MDVETEQKYWRWWEKTEAMIRPQLENFGINPDPMAGETLEQYRKRIGEACTRISTQYSVYVRGRLHKNDGN